MIFEHRYERDGFSVEAAIAKGRALPEWLDDEPTLSAGEEFCLQAYADLSTGRGQNGYIPWRDALAYAGWCDLEPDLATAFVQTIRGADVEFMAYIDREKKAQQARGSGAPSERPKVNRPGRHRRRR